MISWRGCSIKSNAVDSETDVGEWGYGGRGGGASSSRDKLAACRGEFGVCFCFVISAVLSGSLHLKIM